MRVQIATAAEAKEALGRYAELAELRRRLALYETFVAADDVVKRKWQWNNDDDHARYVNAVQDQELARAALTWLDDQ